MAPHNVTTCVALANEGPVMTKVMTIPSVPKTGDSSLALFNYNYVLQMKDLATQKLAADQTDRDQLETQQLPSA